MRKHIYIFAVAAVSLLCASWQAFAQPITSTSTKTCIDGTPIKTHAFTEVHAGGDDEAVIAGVASKKIYIHQWRLQSTADVTFRFTEGTGADCVTGPTDVTQNTSPFTTVNRAFDSPTLVAPISTNTAGDTLCSNAGAATITGWLLYCQEP